jgi:hypothetical protein
MKTKVSEAGRRWLTPWHFAVFAIGAVVGSILGGFYGAAYTSAAVIVTCWFSALMLVAFDHARIIAPRSGSSRQQWYAQRTKTNGSSKPSQALARRSIAGAAPEPIRLDPVRRSRLRTIAGGKSEPPWRAS